MKQPLSNFPKSSLSLVLSNNLNVPRKLKLLKIGKQFRIKSVSIEDHIKSEFTKFSSLTQNSSPHIFHSKSLCNNRNIKSCFTARKSPEMIKELKYNINVLDNSKKYDKDFHHPLISSKQFENTRDKSKKSNPLPIIDEMNNFHTNQYLKIKKNQICQSINSNIYGKKRNLSFQSNCSCSSKCSIFSKLATISTRKNSRENVM